MSNNTLSHPTRRFLMDRLDKLHDALQNLGQRLRASISQIIGTQVGDAVQEAIDSLLHTRPISSYPDRRPQSERWPDQRGYEYGQQESNFWNGYEPEPEEPFQHDSEPMPEQRASRWKSLLTGLVQLATWWWQRGPTRPSLRKLIVIGAAVGVTSLVAGPLAGGLVMTIGMTVLMTRLADTVSDTVRQLASMPEP